MYWFWIFFFALCGAILGSFTTAITYRTKNRQSWIKNIDETAARSACPQCNHLLSIWDLVPIMSFLSLGGKCRYCESVIPRRYLAIELISVFCAVLIFIFFGFALLSLFLLIILPFSLAQIILYHQDKIVSWQLFSIIIIVIIVFAAVYWT